MTRRLDGEPVEDGNCCLVRIDGKPPSSGISPDGITFNNLVFGRLQGGLVAANIKDSGNSPPQTGSIITLPNAGTFTPRVYLYTSGNSGITFDMAVWRNVQEPYPGGSVLLETVSGLGPTVADDTVIVQFGAHSFVANDSVMFTFDRVSGASPSQNWGGLILFEGAAEV